MSALFNNPKFKIIWWPLVMGTLFMMIPTVLISDAGSSPILGAIFTPASLLFLGWIHVKSPYHSNLEQPENSQDKTGHMILMWASGLMTGIAVGAILQLILSQIF